MRQSATEAFQYSQPVYAGASELADVSLPPDPSTAAVLCTEYLTGGAMGTDEILAQYTAEDLLTNQGGFSPVSHPIQDVNRRVFMTLRSAVGQPTKVAERAVYSAFGERNILERSTTDTFGNTWTPRGFGPQFTGGPRPNGLSDPLSQVGQVHGFQGRRHEDLPGVMDFRNRLYDPRLGRFLERDPAGIDFNQYAFCNNNPINNIDPMGLGEEGLPGDANHQPPPEPPQPPTLYEYSRMIVLANLQRQGNSPVSINGGLTNPGGSPIIGLEYKRYNVVVQPVSSERFQQDMATMESLFNTLREMTPSERASLVADASSFIWNMKKLNRNSKIKSGW